MGTAIKRGERVFLALRKQCRRDNRDSPKRVGGADGEPCQLYGRRGSMAVGARELSLDEVERTRM